MEAAQISSLTGQTEVRAGGEVISIKFPPAPTPDWHNPGREQDQGAALHSCSWRTVSASFHHHKSRELLVHCLQEWPTSPWGSDQWPQDMNRINVNRMECLCHWEPEPSVPPLCFYVQKEHKHLPQLPQPEPGVCSASSSVGSPFSTWNY